MVEDYALRRREYVAEIRKSFDQNTNEMEEYDIPFDDSGIPILLFKLRIFAALCIFTAFLFCKYNGYDFYHWNPSEVIDIITDNHYYTELQDYVMIQEQHQEQLQEQDTYNIERNVTQ